MIRDIGGVGTHLIYGGVSTPPVYRESFGENRWIRFPPNLPLCGVGGRIGGMAGRSGYPKSSGWVFRVLKISGFEK